PPRRPPPPRRPADPAGGRRPRRRRDPRAGRRHGADGVHPGRGGRVRRARPRVRAARRRSHDRGSGRRAARRADPARGGVPQHRDERPEPVRPGRRPAEQRRAGPARPVAARRPRPGRPLRGGGRRRRQVRRGLRRGGVRPAPRPGAGRARRHPAVDGAPRAARRTRRAVAAHVRRVRGPGGAGPGRRRPRGGARTGPDPAEWRRLGATRDGGRTVMYAEERQQAILALARSKGRVDVVALAEEFSVTTETIRRDLTVLERAGTVRRVHGGAMPVERLGFEPELAARDAVMTEEKQRIAKAALEELPAEGSIIVDAGTTTARFVQMLPTDRELTVIVNSPPHASVLAARPNLTVIILGGRVRGRTLATVDDWVLRPLADLWVDVAFMATNGCSVERGLTTSDQA